jgi:hypothetical protein
MDLTATAGALVLCLILLLALVIVDRRPYHPGKLNPIPLMVIVAIACIVLGKRLIDLLR